MCLLLFYNHFQEDFVKNFHLWSLQCYRAGIDPHHLFFTRHQTDHHIQIHQAVLDLLHFVLALNFVRLQNSK